MTCAARSATHPNRRPGRSAAGDARPAVIFDMDGVLVDSAESHFRSWQVLVEEIQGSNIAHSNQPPPKVTRDLFASTFGRQNRDIIPLLFGQVSPERLRILADRKEAIYRDLIRSRPPIVSGAVDLIRGLAEADITLAVGSSGPLANIRLVLEAMQVADLIPTIVSGDDVTRGKPDPQVFALCCERLGVAPERCIVIEDAPVGIEAARSAGTRTIAVLMHHPKEAFIGADLIVQKLADLTPPMVLELGRRTC